MKEKFQMVAIYLMSCMILEENIMRHNGGWFIVITYLPTGQISNHYENKYWNEFHCEEREFADEWDEHTSIGVLNRLNKLNKLNND